MSTGRSPIFCSAVLALFSFPNSPFSSQLHPFRTLKVQWGRMSSAAGGLAQEVLRTQCRLLDFNPKNSTGRSPIFGLAFFGPFPFPNAPFHSQLHPFRTLKVQQGGRQEVLRTHCRLRDFNPKHSTGRSPIFGLAFFGPFPFPNAPFRSQLHPFRTLKVQNRKMPKPPPTPPPNPPPLYRSRSNL